MSTSAPTDVLAGLTAGFESAAQEIADRSAALWEPWQQAWEALAARPPRPSRHRKGCRCDHGHDDACDGEPEGHRDHDCGDRCACCVPEADVVVHARVGERRVVPFLLRNARHRDREVSVEVGPWHGGSGDQLSVQADVDVPVPLTLTACERRLVRLSVSVTGVTDPRGGTSKGQGGDGQGGDGEGGADVRSCASAYADIRFEGCARPQRVAVVVHPASCDAVETACDCGCC